MAITATSNPFPLSAPVMLSNLLIPFPVAVIERGYCPIGCRGTPSVTCWFTAIP